VRIEALATDKQEVQGTTAQSAGQPNGGMALFMFLLKSFACGGLTETAVFLLFRSNEALVLAISGISLMTIAAFWLMHANYSYFSRVCHDKTGIGLTITLRLLIEIVVYLVGCFISYWANIAFIASFGI
jgi:hypothetical protein